MGWYDGVGVSWFGWMMMVVLMVVFWLGLIAVIATVARRYWLPRRDAGSGAFHEPGGPPGALREQPGQPPVQPTRHESPEDILAMRFARGEINEDEYRARLNVLRH